MEKIFIEKNNPIIVGTDKLKQIEDIDNIISLNTLEKNTEDK